MQIEVEHNFFPNVGYHISKVPDYLMQEIRQAASTIIASPESWHDKKYNHILVGHLKQEYGYTASAQMKDYVEFMGNQYLQAFGAPPIPNLSLISMWVNLQRKHEFNPPHTHDGQLSFVIWVNIPYDLDEELEYFPDTRDRRTSKFEFMYQTILGTTCSVGLPISKEWEGKICMFPANLTHSVNPFYTSDGIRISVAGNLG